MHASSHFRLQFQKLRHHTVGPSIDWGGRPERKGALPEGRHEHIPEVGKWLAQIVAGYRCQPTARRYMRFATMSLCSGTGNCAGAARGRTWCGSGWRNWLTNFSRGPVSSIPGQVCDLPSDTRGRSRVREFRSHGSVRGAPSNGRPYREQRARMTYCRSSASFHLINLAVLILI